MAQAGMAFCGALATEEENSAIDPFIFEKVGADYAALGHIHGMRTAHLGKSLAVYPGSARVWRRGETKARSVVIVETAPKVHTTIHPLLSAGQFRSFPIALGLDGKTCSLEEVQNSCGKNDYVLITLMGIVENENSVAELQDEIKERFGNTVRLLEVERDVIPVAGISSHPAANVSPSPG